MATDTPKKPNFLKVFAAKRIFEANNPKKDVNTIFSEGRRLLVSVPLRRIKKRQ